MPTKEQVMESLETVLVPGIKRSLVKMNLVSDVKITDHKVDVSVFSAALPSKAQEWLKDTAKDVISKLAGASEVDIRFVDGKPKDLNEVGHIIAVMSGKEV